MVDGSRVGGVRDDVLDVGMEATAERQKCRHEVRGADNVATEPL